MKGFKQNPGLDYLLTVWRLTCFVRDEPIAPMTPASYSLGPVQIQHDSKKGTAGEESQGHQVLQYIGVQIALKMIWRRGGGSKSSTF